MARKSSTTAAESPTKGDSPASSSRPVAPRRSNRGAEFVTIADAARLVDMSRGGIRGLVAAGKLTSELHKGVHYYRRADLRRIALERATRAKMPAGVAASAELAAQAFDHLVQGSPAIELVTKLRLAPETALDLVEKFNRLRDVRVSSRSRDAATPCANACGSVARFCGECAKPLQAGPAESPLEETSRPIDP